MNSVVILTLCLSLLPSTFSYKILFISPLHGYSHANFLGKLADILTAAGHNVTVLQPIVVEDIASRPVHHLTKDVRFLPPNNKVKELNEVMHSAAGNVLWTKVEPAVGKSKIMQTFIQMTQTMFEGLIANSTLLNELREENFDIGIAEPINYTPFAIFDLIGMKTTLSALTLSHFESISEAIGEPLALSYVPVAMSSNTEKMGFFGRIQNLYDYYTNVMPIKENLEKECAMLRKYLPMDNYDELLGKVSYMFVNSNPYLDFTKPTLAKVIPIGGISTDPTLRSKLPEDFEKILSLRPRSVLISFGSIARSEAMPESYKKALLSTFVSFPNVTFIWKYEIENDRFAENVSNVVLTSWTPQAALLADPRVAAFITHCGLGGINEVSNPGKPALVVPIFADQMRNANMLLRHGGAISLSKYDLHDKEKLIEAVDKLLNDKRYFDNAQRLSEMLRNQPIDVKETFLKHVEFAARFGPITTLDPHGRHLSFIQYYLIDIALFAFALVTVLLVVSFKVFKLIYSRFLFTNDKFKAA